MEGCVKRNKRGLGADKGKKANEHTKSEKSGKEDKVSCCCLSENYSEIFNSIFFPYGSFY